MSMIEQIHQIIFGILTDNLGEVAESKQTWSDLTEAELKSCLPIAKLTGKPGVWFTTAHAMTALRAAEAKLKEKNQQ